MQETIFRPYIVFIEEQPKQPDDFGEIFDLEAYLGKYLNGKCSSERFQQVSFKYFLKVFLISKATPI